MPMPLEDWQRRLERHFTQLAKARSHSGFPLFALEHDLTDSEFEEIGTQLRSRLALGLRLDPHWLLWVVYATELGYDYDGGEYWHSFEERTPRWRDKGSRNQIREWFSRFQLVYQGVTPSGTWAGQFPIIAWPITHAILSKYLQWQFAKALYDLRYRLAGLEALSPEAVGQLLAANAWEASSRFQEFLQQEALTGRIVLALLSDRNVEGQSPIYPQTLQRLVSGLERVQSTREWLKETRRFVADRLKGAGRGTAGRLTGLEVQSSGRREEADASLSIRPSLMLRRSGTSAWSAIVDIPSFAGIAGVSSEMRALLAGTRCRIAGAGDTWLPKGWLLSGARRRVLKSWPGASVPLVRFELPVGMLEHSVASETRLSAGPVWLCRIGRDGLAHEIAGRIVRPDRKYILLSETADLLSRHRFLAACDLDCDGVTAAILAMPDTVPNEISNGLEQLGMHVARTVRIWPAGLSGRSWDGEGYSEWLTTEEPCFGIVHDHPVDQYGLSLNHGAEILIKARNAGCPVFVKISPLAAGSHTLCVRTRRSYQASATSSSPAAEGVVTLQVREPEPWLPGTTSHAGLAISLDPNDPSLDTFWEGGVGVSVLGPAGRHVTCTISLSSAGGTELLSDEIGTFDLPVTAAEWAKKFSQFAKDEGRAWTYLEAASGRFRIRGDELGEFALRLERDVKPVRWVCRSINRVPTVRLIDDTGGDEAAICRFFSLRRPAEPMPLATETVLAGFPVPPPGGLFEARHGDFQDTIIVSVPQIGGGFQDLVVEPDLHGLDGDTVQVPIILDLLQRWSAARLLGPLVGLRRGRVTERLINHLYSRLCGRRWAEAEAAYVSNPRPEVELRQLERLVGGSQGFPVVLRRDYERMEAGTATGTQWYAEVAKRYQVCSEKDLCEFALQLASNSDNLLKLPTPVLDGLLLEIKENSVLLRGARLLALLAASKELGFANIGLPRWKW
jgi:hypothetical protein